MPPLSLSLSFCEILLHGSATATKPEGNGGNNCTGNYSIKHPIRPPWRSPLLCLFLVLPCGGGCRGWRVTEQSELVALCDLVIWLDMQSLGGGAGEGGCETGPGKSVAEDRDCPSECIQQAQTASGRPHLTPDHAITSRPDKLFLVLNRKRKEDDKSKQRGSFFAIARYLLAWIVRQLSPDLL